MKFFELQLNRFRNHPHAQAGIARKPRRACLVVDTCEPGPTLQRRRVAMVPQMPAQALQVALQRV